jgi:methylmalonyl-CoA/ethylmalonyl-CoA epimerase
VRYAALYDRCGVSTSHQPGFDIKGAMSKIIRLNHIAILVEDLDSALEFWKDTLGLELDNIKELPEQEARVAFLPSGEGEIELVEPTTQNSGVARYLQKRGPGMHHICFEVDNILDILNQLKEKGVRLINDSPQIDSDGKKYAFIHPESTHGVLVELYEL